MMRADHAAAFIKGGLTYVPWLYPAISRKRTTAVRLPPSYYYGVWLKHLTLLDEATGCGIPESVIELGPGDTIGVGIAALLSGANRYVAIDERAYASANDNDCVAASLIDFFMQRAPFEPSGSPDFRHLLDKRNFPFVLTESILERSLASDRVARIRDAVHDAFSGQGSEMISYRAPLSSPSAADANSADLVISHSVLEHVRDLPSMVGNTHRWLRRGGYCSHQFDLRSHGIVREWDGHRAIGEWQWKVTTGTRTLINRLPFSAVVRCFKDAGLSIIRAERIRREPNTPREQLCSQWRSATDDDLHTEGGYIIAQKA